MLIPDPEPRRFTPVFVSEFPRRGGFAGGFSAGPDRRPPVLRLVRSPPAPTDEAVPLAAK